MKAGVYRIAGTPRTQCFQGLLAARRICDLRGGLVKTGPQRAARAWLLMVHFRGCWRCICALLEERDARVGLLAVYLWSAQAMRARYPRARMVAAWKHGSTEAGDVGGPCASTSGDYMRLTGMEAVWDLRAKDTATPHAATSGSVCALH